MRVLWICNSIIPNIAYALGIELYEKEGWMTKLADFLDEIEEYDFAIASIVPSWVSANGIAWGKNATSLFYGIHEENPNDYSETVEEQCREIVEAFKPSILQVFGTEFPHTLSMIKAFNNPEKTVVHIQGLVSQIAKYYYAGLPKEVITRQTIRDFLRNDSIAIQQRNFEKRGKYEAEALRLSDHVMGRTEWDRNCVLSINPNAKYHYVQEILRDVFYEGRWEYNSCRKYRIFISQGNCSYKGLHYALTMLSELVKDYPEAKLIVAGEDYKTTRAIKHYTYYRKYIDRLIRQLNIVKNVEYVGRLNADQMKEQYLLCNVYLSSSTIENSSNSIAEAMMLGVPVVASDVGGTRSIMNDNQEGLLYRVDSLNEMQEKIKLIFSRPDTAQRLGEKAQKRAYVDHDRDKIFQRVTDVYNSVIFDRERKENE